MVTNLLNPIKRKMNIILFRTFDHPRQWSWHFGNIIKRKNPRTPECHCLTVIFIMDKQKLFSGLIIFPTEVPGSSKKKSFGLLALRKRFMPSFYLILTSLLAFPLRWSVVFCDLSLSERWWAFSTLSYNNATFCQALLGLMSTAPSKTAWLSTLQIIGEFRTWCLSVNAQSL